MSEPEMPAVPQVPAPVEVSQTKDEANYFLHVLDFYREAIKTFVDTIPPMEMLIVLAFLQGALEAQAEHAAEAFDDVRGFFRAVYPGLLKAHEIIHPDEKLGDNGILIVIPSPTPDSPALQNMTDEGPKIIIPGSKLVQ